MEPLWPQLFRAMFRRLTDSKTTKYMKILIIFFSYYILTHSVPKLIEIIEGLQSGMFTMVMNRIIEPEICKIGQLERKMCCIAWINVLCDLSVFKGSFGKDQWVPTLQSIIQTV